MQPLSNYLVSNSVKPNHDNRVSLTILVKFQDISYNAHDIFINRFLQVLEYFREQHPNRKRMSKKVARIARLYFHFSISRATSTLSMKRGNLRGSSIILFVPVMPAVSDDIFQLFRRSPSTRPIPSPPLTRRQINY